MAIFPFALFPFFPLRRSLNRRLRFRYEVARLPNPGSRILNSVLGRAGGVLLLGLPVQLQGQAQLAIILRLQAHQVDIGIVAGAVAGVALLGGVSTNSRL